MTKFIRGKVVAVGIVLSVFYWLLAWVLPIADFIDVLNGVFVGVLLAVVMVYGPLFWSSLRGATFDRTAQLAVGIGCIWASIAISRVFSVWLFATGRTGGFLSSPIGGYAIFLAIIGGALHISAPGYPSANDAPMPVGFAGSNRWLLLASAVMGGLVAYFIRYF